jgi:FkbM family methyltransferase
MNPYQRFARMNFPRFRPSQPTTMVRDVQPVPGSIWSTTGGPPPQRMQGAVVHVGAHIGEEIEDYLAAGFDKIVLVEPNPWTFSRLLVHVEFWRHWLSVFAAVHDMRRPPRIHAVNLAASSRSGIVPFVVTEFPMYSSLLSTASEWVRPVAVINVIARPIDMLLNDLGIAGSEVDLIVLDTQGSEHLVLAGSSAVLPHVNAVVVEMPKDYRYHGQATAVEIDSILSAHGLRRRQTAGATDRAWNAVYLRDGTDGTAERKMAS